MDSPREDRANIDRLHEVVNECGEQILVFNSQTVNQNPEASTSNSGNVQQKNRDASTSNSGNVQQKAIDASTSNSGNVQQKDPDASTSHSGNVQQNLDLSGSNPPCVTHMDSNEIERSNRDSPESSDSSSIHHLVHENVTPPNLLSEDSSSTNEETYSDDSGDFLIQSDEDDEAVDELREIPQIRFPMRNYAMDEEHEEDFAEDRMWVQEDPGASHGPFLGNHGLNIRPDSNRPVDYFHLFFDDAMYTRISNETNTYARQRIQKRSGYYLFISLCIQLK